MTNRNQRVIKQEYYPTHDRRYMPMRGYIAEKSEQIFFSWLMVSNQTNKKYLGNVCMAQVISLKKMTHPIVCIHSMIIFHEHVKSKKKKLIKNHCCTSWNSPRGWLLHLSFCTNASITYT